MKTKTYHQKYLESCRKAREKEMRQLSFKEFSYDQFVKQLNEFYLPRSSGYLGNSGCYHTSRKQGAQ